MSRISITSSGKHSLSAKILVPIFFAWKAILILLAAFCPGPGYDTSALILTTPSNSRHDEYQVSSRVERLGLNLFRWDALYFAKAVQRNYIYEQEWAFSLVYSRILRYIGQYFWGTDDSLQNCVWTGVAISILCHLLSVIVLFCLLNEVLGPQRDGRIPFIASVLHTLSPAALFLSAPYAEALFSLLNFTGMLCYVLSRDIHGSSKARPLIHDALLLLSGFFFAAATLIRTNGLLSGLILFYDVAECLQRILRMQLKRQEARKIAVTCVSGALIASAFVGPQYLAYKEFCTRGDLGATGRPWCDRTVPSIYSWIQSHYWNVGFLRYWTLPNAPLFLLAAPMLWLLFDTSVTVLCNSAQRPSTRTHVYEASGTSDPKGSSSSFDICSQLALPQLVLAITALTSFHVQIINRISSGYPIWYLVVAERLVYGVKARDVGKLRTPPQWVVHGMLMYAIVQGMLFANFLPPA